MFRTAPAPSRSSNSFTLSLGLLHLPLSVLTGTEETAVKRSEFRTIDGVLHPVGRMSYDKVTNEVIEDPQGCVVRHAHDAGTDTWVPLSDDEMENCTMPKKVAEVITFVPLTKLHQAYLPIGLAQVRAKTTGLKGAQKEHAQRAFGLFLAGLKARKVAALVKVALRGPARFAAITPEGDLIWLQASDGIRQGQDLPKIVYSANELSLVGTLIDTIGTGTPVIVDDTAQRITEFVADKAQRLAAGRPAPVIVDEAPSVVPDLMAALCASIDAAKASKSVAS